MRLQATPLLQTSLRKTTIFVSRKFWLSVSIFHLNDFTNDNLLIEPILYKKVLTRIFSRSLSSTAVNFSPMLPKLLPTYPHRVENWGIAMAPLYLKLILIKALPSHLKSLSNLTFSQISWMFVLFLFTLNLPESTAVCSKKRSGILGLMMAKM